MKQRKPFWEILTFDTHSSADLATSAIFTTFKFLLKKSHLVCLKKNKIPKVTEKILNSVDFHKKCGTIWWKTWTNMKFSNNMGKKVTVKRKSFLPFYNSGRKYLVSMIAQLSRKINQEKQFSWQALLWSLSAVIQMDTLCNLNLRLLQMKTRSLL